MLCRQDEFTFYIERIYNELHTSRNDFLPFTEVRSGGGGRLASSGPAGAGTVSSSSSPMPSSGDAARSSEF
jgi:hypothetical protein